MNPGADSRVNLSPFGRTNSIHVSEGFASCEELHDVRKTEPIQGQQGGKATFSQFFLGQEMEVSSVGVEVEVVTARNMIKGIQGVEGNVLAVIQPIVPPRFRLRNRVR